MDGLFASLLDYGAELHAKHNHPRSPAQFARALGIKLIPSDEDSANAGPPAFVTYNERLGLSPQRFSLWHEMAHVVMGWHGIDAEFDHWADEMEGAVAREQAANLLAGVFMVPRNIVREALRKYGATPAAIQHLQFKSGMSEGVCIRRYLHNDLEGSRAVAVFVGSQVVDVAALNFRVPLKRYARMPEPGLVLEGNPKLRRVGKARVMAVWEG